MPQKTRKQVREAQREANRHAFIDVFGDPYSSPPADGNYHRLQNRSSIMVTRNNFDEGRATANPARPNRIDFFVDVENAVEEVIRDKKTLIDFFMTYVEGVPSLTPAARDWVEQSVGRALLRRGISPVAHRYFVAERKVVRN